MVLALWALSALPLAGLLIAACSAPPADPIRLERNAVTVYNQTGEDWSDVEIRLNYHFQVTARRIGAGSHFTMTLDNFVEGYGRRFDFNRMQINDLRLTARRPDGERIELAKRFEKTALAGALEPFGRKP